MRDTTTEDLFRREALASLAKTSLGRPIAFMPRAWHWGGWLCLCLFAVIVFYLSTAEYARKARVRGWLVPRDGVVRISHDRPGLVEQVDIAPGDSVSRGHTLLRVIADRTLADGSSFSERVRAGLDAELREVAASEGLLRQAAVIDGEALEDALVSIDAELESLSRERTILGRRVASARQGFARLDAGRQSGAVSAAEFTAQQDRLGELEQSDARLQQRISSLQRDRDRLLAGGRRASLDRAQRLSGLNRERSRLEQEATRNAADRVAILTAPVAGRVATINVHPGARFLPGQLLASVLPEDNELIAEVYVPSRAIGRVAPGQAVSLSYDAFPPQHFGVSRGRIESIDGFVLLPGEVPGTFAVVEPVYKVRVALEGNPARRVAQPALRGGMLLSADITLERRTIMRWLLGLLSGPAPA